MQLTFCYHFYLYIEAKGRKIRFATMLDFIGTDTIGAKCTSLRFPQNKTLTVRIINVGHKGGCIGGIKYGMISHRNKEVT